MARWGRSAIGVVQPHPEDKACQQLIANLSMSDFSAVLPHHFGSLALPVAEVKFSATVPPKKKERKKEDAHNITIERVIVPEAR